MKLTLSLPELDISPEELRELLAIKLYQDGRVSLGKAAEIAGYRERSFADLIMHRGGSPLKFENLDIAEELRNA